MIAIHTRYIGPSNTRGARVKAYTTTGFSATVPFLYPADIVDAHFEAVKTLVAKHALDWSLDDMRYGDSADGRGYSFCFDASKVQP